MSIRFGLEVRAADVRAVLLQSGGLRWHATACVNESSSLSDAVGRLLESVPKVGPFRPRVVVAVCFARGQVKRLDGLPALTSRAELTQLLRENAGSVFLRTTSAVVVPDVYRSSDGAAWGAAIDRTVIDDVVASANRRGFRVLSFVPSVCALARVFPSTTIGVVDGATQLELTTIGTELRSARRSCGVVVSPVVPAALSEIGDDALSYVGAYAAALSQRNAALAWRPETAPAFAAVVRRVRVVAAALSLLVAGALAIASPGIHDALFVRHAAASIAVDHGRQIETARVEGELVRTTQLLQSADKFAASRGAITRLLAQLTQSLPESTAIVSLRVDSTEGSFVAVSPHVSDVIAELGAVDQMTSPRIVGSVTRETVAGNAPRAWRISISTGSILLPGPGATMNGALGLTRRDRRTVLLGTVTIGGLGLFARGVPAFQAWNETRREEATAVIEQVSQSRRATRLLQPLRDSLLHRELRAAALDSLMIRASSTSVATANLASALEEIADEASVKINALQMRPDTVARSGLTRVAVRLTGVSDVAGLAAFLRGVEGGDLLLVVRELAISQPEPAAADSKPEMLRIDILIEGLGFIRPEGLE